MACSKPLKDVDVVVVGLQEVEMGTHSVARAAVVGAMARGNCAAETSTHNGKWWAGEILDCLNHLEARGTSHDEASHTDAWHRLSMRQMSGLVLIVLARKHMQPECVMSSVVPCGVGGFGGNKGGVAIAVQLYRQRFLFINCHFAAHQVRMIQGRLVRAVSLTVATGATCGYRGWLLVRATI
jgi:hypothetical protein